MKHFGFDKKNRVFVLFWNRGYQQLCLFARWPFVRYWHLYDAILPLEEPAEQARTAQPGNDARMGLPSLPSS